MGVPVDVLAHNRRHRLVKEWQVEVLDVYEFKLGVATLLHLALEERSGSLLINLEKGRSSHKFS